MEKNIIQIALSLFLKYGFKSVTMDDIAEKMRVSKKTIYAHFPNKESLVMKSSEFHFNMVMNHMNDISNHSKDPIIELYQLKKEALKHLSSKKISPQYQLQKYYPDLYANLKEKEFESIGNLFSKSIIKGIKTGLFRKELNVDFVVRIFFNGIKGIKDIRLFPIEQFEIDNLMVAFSEYHLRAICTLQGTSKLEQYKKELNL